MTTFVLCGFLSFSSVLGGQLHKHVFQRRTYFMNLSMSDTNFAQLVLDMRALDRVIDEQMHRLAENCGAAHTTHLVHGMESRGDVVASYVEPARAGRVHVRQLFQVVRLTANNQF